jgi:hypothetical protein
LYSPFSILHFAFSFRIFPANQRFKSDFQQFSIFFNLRQFIGSIHHFSIFISHQYQIMFLPISNKFEPVQTISNFSQFQIQELKSLIVHSCLYSLVPLFTHFLIHSFTLSFTN